MRRTYSTALLAGAALALAACGDGPDGRDADSAERTAQGIDVELPEVPVEYPEVPLDARGTVDYAGTYSQRLGDGRERVIRLGEDDTFTMRDEDGVETSGTFNWYSDNSRILIRNGGDKQVFAVADGAIYRLADENAATDGPMTREQAYVRVIGPGNRLDGSVQDRPDE